MVMYCAYLYRNIKLRLIGPAGNSISVMAGSSSKLQNRDGNASNTNRLMFHIQRALELSGYKTLNISVK